MAILAGNNFNVKDFAPALWLDAADSNTLYDAVSGGALVAAGGAVARWEDKSGNGRHATQATLGNRPTRTVGAQNTRDVLRFDGTNDFLQILTGLNMLRNVAGATVFCVWKYNVVPISGNFVAPFVVSNGTVLGTGRLSMGTNLGTTKIFAGGRRLDADALQRVDSIIDVNTTPFVQTAVLDYANSDIFQFINGSLQGSSTSFQTNGNTSDTDSINIHIGSHSGASNFANIDIAEIIVFSIALSTEQRQSIERYLANKWGLGFNPLSLSPALWLDASDSNTLYDATTGGALVGAGGTVARWEDKSGNARHATQATLANRPLRTAAAQGGKDALTFDGVNDFMATPAFGGTQDCTYFLVTASKNATQIKVFAAHANNYENPPLGANYVSVNAARLETGQNGASGITKFTSKLAASQNLQNNIFRIVGVQFTSTNAGHIQRVNGAAHTTTNAYPQDPGVFTKAAQSFGVGAYNTGGLPCHCDIAELIYFTKLLTASERQAVERYLAQRWNIIT
jgi:hypothetical protein